MGFNRSKMEDERRRAAEKEAAARRALNPQVIEDAERLIADWNERQAKRVPMLFSPTIGAAIAARLSVTPDIPSEQRLGAMSLIILASPRGFEPRTP
jgi:hypothetical protein